MGWVSLGLLATDRLLGLTGLSADLISLQEQVSEVSCSAWDQRFRAWYWGLTLVGVLASLFVVAVGIWRRWTWASRPYLRLLMASGVLFLFPGLMFLLAWTAVVSGGLGPTGISPEYLQCNVDFGATGLVLGIGKDQALVFQPLLLLGFGILVAVLWFALLAAVTWVAARWWPRPLKEDYAAP